MKFKSTTNNKKPRIEIVPMIDVIFFLLVYYMMTAQGALPLQQLKVSLPKAEAPEKGDPKSVHISIDANGKIFINKQETALKALGIVLAEAMRKTPQGYVMIHADQNIAYSHVIAVMDAAKKIGVRKFALATQKL
jgi:biopolymer transport protein ExbD